MYLIRDPSQRNGIPIILRQRRRSLEPIRLAHRHQKDSMEDVHHLCGVDF